MAISLIPTGVHIIKQHHEAQQNDTQHNYIQKNDTQHNYIQKNDTHHNYIQQNDIQHEDTQHKGFICDSQLKRHSA
jgi:hypothetical protein